MAWLDVEWTNGDTPTSTKANQMDDNLDYVRESARGWTVAQEAGYVEASGMGAFDWSLVVAVGGLEFTSSLITGGYADVAGLLNLDISSLTAGVAYQLAVSAKITGGSIITELMAFTFVPRVDMSYLSIFGECTKGSGGNLAAVRGFTAIATRDNEGFT